MGRRPHLQLIARLRLAVAEGGDLGQLAERVKALLRTAAVLIAFQAFFRPRISLISLPWLILVLLLLKALSGKQASFGTILFTSGMVVLPLIMMMAFLGLLSFIEIKSTGGMKFIGTVSSIVMILVLTSVVLLIKASLVSILQYSQKAAFWLVPGTIIAVSYLSGWANKGLSELFK